MKLYKLNAHSTAISPGSYVLVLADDMNTIAATRALSDLVDTARSHGLSARDLGLKRTAFALLNIAIDLDSARTQLVQEGESYLDAAWAFADAGRRMVADYVAVIDRELIDRARA